MTGDGEEIKKGLEGVIAAESSICFIDGEKGKLLYRGYNIDDLATKSNYEEVSYLLIFGRLPTKQELKEFRKRLVAERRLPKNLIKTMKLFAGTTNPMDSLRTSVSLLPSFDKEKSGIDAGISMISKFPVIVATAHRLRNGLKQIKPKSSLGHSANFLYMLSGEKPDEFKEKAMDVDFILHAEHGFNASTFAARVTMSTMSDIYSAVVSAIGTLKGPLHGGAAGKVFEMLKEVGSVDRVESYVKEALANKKKIMGFGHRVYKTMDPRAVHIENAARELVKITGNSRYFDITQKFEEVVVPLLREKRIYPNVDFFSSTVYNCLNIPEELFDSLFAIGRVPGWIAHSLEQTVDNRLIRPREKYTGSMDLQYVPIGKRK
jgi:citrate synthase